MAKGAARKMNKHLLTYIQCTMDIL